jgi:predicted RNase H-like nuclease
VDGCRAGWVVASWERDAAELAVWVVPTFAEVAADLGAGRWRLVAVDMPIGLPEAGPRACDVAARRRLGPRRSTVYPAPVRSVLATGSYAQALAASRAASGVGLSRQAWNLVPKIREVEAAARRVGTDRLLEVHPELGFATLLGAPPRHPKRSAAGRLERRTVLARVLPGLSPDGLPRRVGAADDDIADALALAWSARRLAAGGGERLGGNLDATGLPMAISW